VGVQVHLLSPPAPYIRRPSLFSKHTISPFILIIYSRLLISLQGRRRRARRKGGHDARRVQARQVEAERAPRCDGVRCRRVRGVVAPRHRRRGEQPSRPPRHQKAGCGAELLMDTCIVNIFLLFPPEAQAFDV